jgi:hypothetical protein
MVRLNLLLSRAALTLARKTRRNGQKTAAPVAADRGSKRSQGETRLRFSRPTILTTAASLAASLDHVVPMTRSAADAGAMLNVGAGLDPNDPTSLTALVPDSLAGTRASDGCGSAWMRPASPSTADRVPQHRPPASIRRQEPEFGQTASSVVLRSGHRAASMILQISQGSFQ